MSLPATFRELIDEMFEAVDAIGDHPRRDELRKGVVRFMARFPIDELDDPLPATPDEFVDRMRQARLER